MVRAIMAAVWMGGLLTLLGIGAPPAVADEICTPDRRPMVEDIYPTSDVLPANLLRFYVYFSEPMERSAALEHVTLRSVSTGKAVTGAFFQSRYDLWSTDGRRLTVLLDPGRVKSGLDASDELGRALDVGEPYLLEIGGAISAANGCALETNVIKDFAVGLADAESPSLDQWRLHLPQTNTREPVRIALNGAHDHVSLAYRIRVKTDQGEPVAGAIQLSHNESEWRFTPRTPWTESLYVVRVDPALEDLAGNRFAGLFDDPTGESRVNQAHTDTYELEFWPAE